MKFDVYSLKLEDYEEENNFNGTWLRELDEGKLYKSICLNWNKVKDFYKSPDDVECDIQHEEWDVVFPAELVNKDYRPNSFTHLFWNKDMSEYLEFIPEEMKWHTYNYDTKTDTYYDADLFEPDYDKGNLSDLQDVIEDAAKEHDVTINDSIKNYCGCTFSEIKETAFAMVDTICSSGDPSDNDSDYYKRKIMRLMAA